MIQMQKKTFISLVLGVLGGLMFSIGMCMCLLPEWGMFKPGVVVTAIGAVALLILFIWLRKQSGKAPAKPDWKLIGKIAYGVLAALILGLGMCLIMVWGKMLLGLVIGVVGILLLLGLIPMFMGLK